MPSGRIDLHAHTIRSDGLLEPADLYAAMAAAGVGLAAISDHDTLDGYRELVAAGLGDGRDGGPLLVPAVEINSIAPHVPDLPEGELHILGYGVDPDDAVLEAALERQRRARRARLEEMLERLAAAGYPIADQLPHVLTGDVASAGRPHLARAMIRAGYAATIEEAFDLALSPGRPGYVPRVGVGPREAIELIRGAGGIAVLAHFPLALERPEIVDELESWGLVGLEVYYRKFEPRLVERLAMFAAERGLLATAGTDFHGDGMTYTEALARIDPPATVGDRLLEAIAATKATGEPGAASGGRWAR